MAERPLRTYADFEGDGGSDIVGQVTAQARAVAERLREVRHVVAVASGKGGVGKSTVTAMLAAALARRGLAVAALDADLQGPSLPRLMGVPARQPELAADGVVPPEDRHGVRLMSSELFLGGDAQPLRYGGPRDHAFAWRPAAEATTLRELLANVRWGRRDVLLVDLPPGSDRLPTLAQVVPQLAGAIVVTLGSPVSLAVVARSVTFARENGVRLLGMVENMAGYPCPECGGIGPLFAEREAAAAAARALELPLLAAVPFDAGVAAAAGRGESVTAAEGPAGRAHDALAATLSLMLEERP